MQDAVDSGGKIYLILVSGNDHYSLFVENPLVDLIHEIIAVSHTDKVL